MRSVALALFCLLPLAGHAQSITCDPNGPLQAMNACAYDEFDRADAALNAAYKKAMAAAREMGFADKLRDAQRLWIPYRDAACEAESMIFEGGRMQPLIRYTCLAELTNERAKHLEFFMEM